MSKRRAEDPLDDSGGKRIKALDQDVVNKIAAGEIIVEPMNALKELLENAVDAHASKLDIQVKDGGLKLLQITDDGDGIHKDDLGILCERFTTSKLKEFEDLSNIQTYGFRGEALASISHIAVLKVTTRTKDSGAAFKAKYVGGKMVPWESGGEAQPIRTHGNQGTRIQVEDLFYNVPQRRRAFKSPSEDYAKILNVVGRYAVHCEGISFSCRKAENSSMSIAIKEAATKVDRIRQVFGASVANELLHFELKDDRLAFEASGYTTSANYHAKKTYFLLFVNNRSVDSSVLNKAIQRLYSSYLPHGGHQFTYLSLSIDPMRVDVNVHPTKREVNFLNETEIADMVCSKIQEELAKVDTSRTFLTQNVIHGSGIAPPPTGSAQKDSKTRKVARPAENNFVRTDPTARKITSMLSHPDSTQSSSDQPQYTTTDQPAFTIRLASIKELRSAVRDVQHGQLAELFGSHTYVGLVDSVRRIAAVQSGIKLYLVDYGMLCAELFYQIGLTDFGNFGRITFKTPLDLKELIGIAAASGVEELPDDESADEVADQVSAMLVENREMLAEYFKLEISEDGQLNSLPLLLKGYNPSMGKLPRFLMRLGPCVDWSGEKECFRTFLAELAAFYVPEQLPNPTAASAAAPSADQPAAGPDAMDVDAQEQAGEQAKRRAQVARALEHAVFPAVKSRLVATQGLLGAVREVADLKGLYREFERC